MLQNLDILFISNIMWHFVSTTGDTAERLTLKTVD